MLHEIVIIGCLPTLSIKNIFDLGAYITAGVPNANAVFVSFTDTIVVNAQNTDWLFFSSITYLTLHDPSFVGGEEPWDNSSLDLERRYRLGSEVTSLSLSRSSSSDKSDPLDNLNLNFRLTSSMK